MYKLKKLNQMKKNLLYILAIGIISILATSCSEDDLNSESQIKDPLIEENDFDKWIYNNYVVPYNIDFKYRFEDIESDMNYTLEPAQIEKSVRMAKTVQQLILGAYDELTGSKAFLRQYYPKILHLVGSPAYRNNNTIILATAENGYKITLYNVNTMPLSKLTENDTELLNLYYFKTLHHEFGHILNQTKPYSSAFKEISGPDYVQDSWNTAFTSDAAAQKAGFISPYASSGDGEDFVEIYAIYITNSKAKWDGWITAAGTTGAGLINQKLEIVRNYMLNSWNIDLDQLRSIVLRRQGELLSMDLDSLN
jgi:substrate import-associated zinc metallohydrolase lipoprotein